MQRLKTIADQRIAIFLIQHNAGNTQELDLLNNMTENFWDRGSNSRIISAKIYVLARSVKPDNKYKNTNSYQLGDLKVTFNDNYRRLLFSSTVSLYNARINGW